MGELRAMDRTGDRNVFRWGDNPRDIEQARATFERYRAAGYAMYRLDEDDEQGERMTAFDADVHGILAVPRMVGG